MKKKYTLSFRDPFTSNWSKAHYESLVNAMTTAWRKHRGGYSVNSIIQGHEVVINNEVMAQALDEMDNLVRDTPGRKVSEIIEQVMQGITKPGAEAA